MHVVSSRKKKEEEEEREKEEEEKDVWVRSKYFFLTLSQLNSQSCDVAESIPTTQVLSGIRVCRFYNVAGSIQS